MNNPFKVYEINLVNEYITTGLQYKLILYSSHCIFVGCKVISFIRFMNSMFVASGISVKDVCGL